MKQLKMEKSKEYIPDPCFHEAIKKIKEHFEKIILNDVKENLELEFRLGYLENNEFKTDIGKDFFDKITDQLLDCEDFDNIIYENSEDYFHSGRRMTIIKPESSESSESSKPKITFIKKIKLAVLDFIFEGTGFDLRVSFCIEQPAPEFPIEKANYKRIKERSSYIYKHLSYDLTRVTQEDNTVDDHFYEVELEVKSINLKKMTSHYLIHDALLKIKDLVNMCEDPESETKLQFVKEKNILNC